MGQVAPVLTPYSIQDTAGAFVTAYRQLTGDDPPSKETWLYPVAQAVTAEGWAYNNNPGNLTTYGTTGDWYFNPHVTAGLKFRSFDSLVDGAQAMLVSLKDHGCLSAAENSDLGTYCSRLSPWYLGSSGDYGRYCANIRAGVSRYAGVVPIEPGFGSKPWLVPAALGLVLVSAAGAAAMLITQFGPPRLPRFARAVLGEESYADNPEREATHVQSLLFPRDRYSPSQARRWAKSHGYRTSPVVTTDRYIHIPQRAPSGIIRTITFGGSGIKAHIERAA